MDALLPHDVILNLITLLRTHLIQIPFSPSRLQVPFHSNQVGGRTVKVNFPEMPKGGEREVMASRIRSSERSFVDSPYKIYVGNLGWGVTSRGLRDSGRSRGLGFIAFESAGVVKSALEAMNEVEPEGQPLLLNIAADKSLSPFDRSYRAYLDSSQLLSSLSSQGTL